MCKKQNKQTNFLSEACESHRITLSRQGFSLLEVLVVLALMLTIASFALPNWNAQQASIQQSLAWLQVQQIAIAQAEYYVHNHDYAEELDDLAIILAENRHYQYSTQKQGSGYLAVAQLRSTLSENSQTYQSVCWQLIIDENGSKQALNKQSEANLNCL